MHGRPDHGNFAIYGEKGMKRVPDGSLENYESGGRKGEIARVAARLFLERGYSGTTVRDLAREVGVTSGSIFYHFGSKEEILLEVVATGLRASRARFNDLVSGGAAPRDRLRAMVLGHLEALHGGAPEALSIFFNERHLLSEPVQQAIVSLRDSYEAVWDEALATLGGVYADPVERRVRRLLLLGALNWTVLWYDPDGPLGFEEITQSAMSAFIVPAGPGSTQ